MGTLGFWDARDRLPASLSGTLNLSHWPSLLWSYASIRNPNVFAYPSVRMHWSHRVRRKSWLFAAMRCGLDHSPCSNLAQPWCSNVSSSARGLAGLPQTPQSFEAGPMRGWNHLHPHEQSAGITPRISRFHLPQDSKSQGFCLPISQSSSRDNSLIVAQAPMPMPGLLDSW